MTETSQPDEPGERPDTEASLTDEATPSDPEATPTDEATPADTEATPTDEATPADPDATTRPTPVDAGRALASDPPPAVVEQGDRPGVDRTTDRRLARLHLRTGARALARAELETLAGAGGLDEEALLDLAEIRWRTDDLTGAGEAAAAYLASGREASLALVIVAEATAALGRPGEARRLANRAVELIDGPLDAVFAGMPHSGVWPVQTVERAEVAGGEPAGPNGPGESVESGAVTLGVNGAAGGGPGSAPRSAVGIAAGGAVAAGAATRSDPAGAANVTADAEAMPDPAAELAAARAAIAAGDRSGAAIRLAVVLRLAPALAPAVLDIAAAEPGPGFDLVRGDALRLVGRESQARRSFAAARGSASRERDPDHDRASEPGSDPDG